MIISAESVSDVYKRQGITPYITSSIIVQLLTIAIPKLEEMQKDGEDGRKKIQTISRYLTVALALIESIAMTVGFGSKGLLAANTIPNKIVVIAAMTAGSAFLMWIGEETVSYTHLDVYKRQGKCHAPAGVVEAVA